MKNSHILGYFFFVSTKDTKKLAENVTPLTSDGRAHNLDSSEIMPIIAF